ncbi:NitT/TauT family transport system permease protein [Microbacteriaceae bacterium SG_E_30_P1]|uniref:NitT/TauT family transport system permease protein n=1 Tax=Antiquaquibacter oligotrophicus TaxID=2880260 RepID=A0ABT6KP60_9MICO|nr:ABC transporter permease [Antiquaquibacter oligotrophicus]MDH6181555.1 NitT/TauT family transport system permease protein [Antiquaquibacter oligotrophicus]UDF12757.1 ABC transporter permease [Antiquaquibacter oligotrophicus]
MADTTLTASDDMIVAAPATGGTPHRRKLPDGPGKIYVWGPPLLVLAAVIGGWFFISLVVLGERSFLLPPPNEVLGTLLVEKTRNDVITSFLSTAQVALIGLVIASVIGIVWAITMNVARWVERSTFPYAVILQAVPILAIAPVITIWVNDAFWARTIVCVLIALFPMVSNTLFGLQSVDRGHRELFKLQKASRFTVLRKLELPAATPAIFAGLRISAGLAVVGAIVGDFFFQRGVLGLGALMRKYQSRVDNAELLATVLVAVLFGVLVFLLFGLLSKIAVGKWYDN